MPGLLRGFLAPARPHRSPKSPAEKRLGRLSSLLWSYGELDSSLRTPAAARGRGHRDPGCNAEAGQWPPGARDHAHHRGLARGDRSAAQTKSGCVLRLLSRDLIFRCEAPPAGAGFWLLIHRLRAAGKGGSAPVCELFLTETPSACPNSRHNSHLRCIKLLPYCLISAQSRRAAT